MLELTGKYNTAKVFTDNVDSETISQVINLMNQPFVEGSSIRIMPDTHAGAGCVIGTTMTITDKVCPNLVGVDIGCGMLTMKLEEKNIDLNDLDRTIHERIPSGFSIRDTPHSFAGTFTDQLETLKIWKRVNQVRAILSVSSLGGGNHFIECNRDEEGRLYLVIHSGSRHLGVEIAKHYQNAAYNQINSDVAILNDRTKEVTSLAERLKAEGRQKEIEQEIRNLNGRFKTSVPKALAYASGDLLQDYLHDMVIAQKYAFWNRAAIADEIISGLGLHIADQFQTIHNYIDMDYKILRKGAVSAREGERLIIPINMRDGSLLCTGKGNPDWNYSAPHGAGRLMSRSKAKEILQMEDYEKSMQGIYSTSVNRNTLDEAPFAYKPMGDIIRNVQNTVTIEKIIKPIYNFKAAV